MRKPGRILTLAGAAVIAAAATIAASDARAHDARFSRRDGPLGSRSGAPALPVQAATDAQAPPVGALEAEVMVLYATNQPNGGGGIDPKIGALPALRKPPFSSFNTYQLLSRSNHPLSKGAPATSALPNGGTVQVFLRELLPSNRYRLDATVNQANGSAFLPRVEVTTPAGEVFFVAGQAYKAGMLVIGITVLK